MRAASARDVDEALPEIACKELAAVELIFRKICIPNSSKVLEQQPQYSRAVLIVRLVSVSSYYGGP